MRGAFQMSRDIFENPIWEDPVKFRIFFFIIGNAVFSQDGVTHAGVHLKRGQYLRSLRKLREDLTYREGKGNAIKQYPLTTIQRKLKSLENEEKIIMKTLENGTLFTVINYEKYQGLENYKKHEMEQLRNSDGTVTEQERNNNKNVKECSKNDSVVVTNTHETNSNHDVDKIAERYADLRTAQEGKEIYPSITDYDAIAQVVARGIPLPQTIKWLDQCFEEYRERDPNGAIKSFKYCMKYIESRHEESLAKSQAKEVKPSGGIAAVIEQIKAKANEVQKNPSLADKQDGLIEREPKCNECQDKLGWLEDRNGIEVYVKCPCREQRALANNIRTSEITDSFRKADFKTFQTEDKPEIVQHAYECAVTYFKDFKDIYKERCNSIQLLGSSGAGKTHLLTAVANYLMRTKIPDPKEYDKERQRYAQVHYFPFVEGFNNLRDDFEKLEAKINRMQTVDVLFIDDLFKPVSKWHNGERIKVPRATEWQIEQMQAVVNYRYLNHKPVLVSSEWDVDGLFDVDEALASRLYEMSKDYTVVIKGDRMKLNHRMGD
ncbi:DNA replication protein DnaC [Geomicrobium sp. JCM 19038]|nr:DNA replication protein DnaC [Geomicrobium sp. JCM 19038]